MRALASATEKPCAQIAVKLPELLQLLPSLDSLGDHLDIEMPGHRDDRADDREVAHVCNEVADEASVDLHVVHAPSLEVREAGIAGSEVVDGYPHSQLTQLGDALFAALPERASRCSKKALSVSSTWSIAGFTPCRCVRRRMVPGRSVR